MGRKPCCMKEGLKRGAWSVQEDRILVQYIKAHGEGKWRDLPSRAGLKRCGKSCRLRWLNYLNPNIKRGNITPDEEDLIIKLHKLLGNRWSLIAGRLPGRTDNEIKNYWNTCLSKKIKSLSNSAKHHEATGAAVINQPHQVIRTKAVRCNKVYPQLGHEDTEAKQRPALPTASSVSDMASVLLQETDLPNYFVDLIDQELLPGVHEDLFMQAWQCDIQEYGNDIYEGNGRSHILPDQLEEAIMEEWARTLAFQPSL